MNRPKRFRLSLRGMLVAMVSAAFAHSALANTGHVDFTIGNVNLTDANGRVQPLKKGDEVRSGDRIVSGVDGRTQIRFSDGAYVSLQPNSDFDIKEYRFDGKTDGTESAVFSLFKGALRTVTGLVGRVNRNKYSITTPTATIGIRGTGGVISVGADGSTLVTGTSGIWTLSNNGGTLEIPAGSSGFAGNPNLPPKQSTTGPTIPPAQPPQQAATFVQGDTKTGTGGPASLFTPLTSGPGYSVGVGDGGVGSNASVPFGAPLPASAVFDASGQLIKLTADLDGPAFQGTFTLLGTSAPPPETFSDGVLAWGRWIGPVQSVVGSAAVTTIVTYSENQGLHYVIGTPTPVLPTAGTFTYNLIGATNPTFADGLNPPGKLNSAVLVGDFGAGSLNVQVNATGGDGKTYLGNASGLIGPTFSVTASGSGTGCAVSCTFRTDGFFAGTNATHAGIVYDFQGTAQGSTLTGAAALKR